MNREMSLDEAIEIYTRTESFCSSTPFTKSDMSTRLKQSNEFAMDAIRVMLLDGVIVPTVKDSKGNERFIKSSESRKLIIKKWRKENVGELAYYKGFNHFGNADTGWRGSL